MEEIEFIGKAYIMVSGESRRVDIFINPEGNLVLNGIGSVTYEMYGEELVFSKP